jgi:hypothetical protein
MSCRVEKRIYRKGYHVVWDHQHKGRSEKTPVIQTQQKISVPNEKPEQVIVLNENKDLGFLNDLKKPALLITNDTCGDKIFFKNGTIVSAKVVEVDREKIKYKRCDNLDGPLFTVNKRSLTMVQYYNGVKEDLGVEDETYVAEQAVKKEDEKASEPMGVTSFVCSLLGWIFGITLLLAVPLAIGSLSHYKKEPGKYKGKGLPIAALILSVIIASFWSYLFYLLFAALAWGGIVGINIFSVFFGVLALVALIGLIAMS